MSAVGPVVGSLVLYKDRAARVVAIRERIEIQLADGDTLRVRAKDICLLHPGPVQSLADLEPVDGDVDTAWELLAGSSTTLPELAELIFGAYTPRTAWATWELIREGLRFQGTPLEVTIASADEVAHRKATRAADAARRREWSDFLERVRSRILGPDDPAFLADVVDLAMGRAARSRVLRDLGRTESPEDAHALLLELGQWSEQVNPYPARLGVPLAASTLQMPPLPPEERVDLTHHCAVAIDDDLNGLADDALSYVDGRLWVHVADPGAVVRPGDVVDLDARGRGAALYLPERSVPMLPDEAGRELGLGNGHVSPALSFCLEITEGGARAVDIVPSIIRVTRLTYAAAEDRLEDEPFSTLRTVTDSYQDTRRTRGAVTLSIPEVDIRVVDGRVEVRAVPPLRSRGLVQEAMIMAGEATARWALERGVTMPFACQELGGVAGETDTLSSMYATRRILRPRQYRTTASRHASLGLEAYIQVTSPLRRYLDLVAHQQIRAVREARPPLEMAELVERIGAVEAVMGGLRAAEQLSNRHWTLVYLMARPGWRGTGVIVEKRGRSAHVLVGELGLETTLMLNEDLPLDSVLPLILMGVRLPTLEAHFRVGP